MEPLSVEEALKEKGYSGKELSEAVREKKKEYAGLLTKEDALRLLAIEKGIPVEKEVTEAEADLSKVGEGAAFNARVTVVRAFRPHEFESNGRKGLVANADVAQGKAGARLVLWNKEAELVSNGTVRRGARLLLENVIAKKGSGGSKEVHSRYLSRITREALDAPAPAPLSELSAGSDWVVEGIVSANSGARGFDSNGRKGAVCNLELSSGLEKAALVCWGYNASVAAGFKLGDRVRVEGAEFKNNELHAGSNAAVFKESSEPERLEKTAVASVGEGKRAVVKARLKSLFEAKETGSGGVYLNGELEDDSGFKRFVAFGENAFALLGGKPAKVKPSTLLDIKRGYLLGRTAVLGVRGKTNDYNGEIELVVEEVGSLEE